ncbi:MAG TPA: GrpB family protein [Allosphingosinicella sp.]|nr:GrpB family protein [Allosphingosinicella sp.]
MGEYRVALGVPQGRGELVGPTSAWAPLFEAEAARIAAALRPFEARIEHCGSTSVPGNPAKPIIDILIAIKAPIDVAALADALAAIGYEHANWAGVPGHEVFGKDEPRTHLLHVVPDEGEAWARMLAFRDALRSDPALAAEYAALKQDLAQRFPDNRSAYTDGKSGFVTRVLEAARGPE